MQRPRWGITASHVNINSHISPYSQQHISSLIDVLETVVQLHKDSIQRLEGEVDSWKTQAHSWQKHADNSLRLLTDERENLNQQPDIDLSPAEQGDHTWRNVLVALAVVGVIAAAYYFRGELVNTWERVIVANQSSIETIPDGF